MFPLVVSHCGNCSDGYDQTGNNKLSKRCQNCSNKISKFLYTYYSHILDSNRSHAYHQLHVPLLNDDTENTLRILVVHGNPNVSNLFQVSNILVWIC